MARSLRFSLCVILLVVLALPVAMPTPAAGPGPTQAAGALFVENAGQFDPSVRFGVPCGERILWLAEDGLWVTVRQPAAGSLAAASESYTPSAQPKLAAAAPATGAVHLKLSYIGANPHPRLEPFNRLQTRVSYFIGTDASQWHTDVPVWGGVRYVDLYPGLDLELSGEGGQLQQRWLVRNARSLAQVRLQIEGALALGLDGQQVRVQTQVGDFSLPLPSLGGASPLGAPRLEGNLVVAPFSTSMGCLGMASLSRPADLLFGSFLGGTRLDQGNAIAVDGDLHTYIVGQTASADFPASAGPGYDTQYHGYYDCFVVKLDVAGTSIEHATFLGGTGTLSQPTAVAVDTAGHAVVVGYVSSGNFPASLGPGYDTSFNGPPNGADAFAVKLSPTGTALVYATFLGGSDWDQAYGVALDDAGHAYITGYTVSADFPAALGPGFDTTFNGQADVFVLKLNPAGTGLVYATYLGGAMNDAAYGLAVDPAGQVYVAGITASAGFPAALGPGYDTTYASPGWDGFVIKLNESGTALVYATFLGGTSDDRIYALALDTVGRAYVTGLTNSADFPAAAGPGFDTEKSGGYDAFAVRLDAAGTTLSYATFIGSAGTDRADGIAVDVSGQATLIGTTDSAGLITGPGFDTQYHGTGDAFLIKLDPVGTGLVYATYLGGSARDWGTAVAVDVHGRAYATGYTYSTDFLPAAGPGYDTSPNGDSDGFALKLHTTGKPDWDVNGDGSIDIADMATAGLYWGRSGPPFWIPADVNRDGTVDIGDMATIGLYWGKTY